MTVEEYLKIRIERTAAEKAHAVRLAKLSTAVDALRNEDGAVFGGVAYPPSTVFRKGTVTVIPETFDFEALRDGHTAWLSMLEDERRAYGQLSGEVKAHLPAPPKQGARAFTIS